MIHTSFVTWPCSSLNQFVPELVRPLVYSSYNYHSFLPLALLINATPVLSKLWFKKHLSYLFLASFTSIWLRFAQAMPWKMCTALHHFWKCANNRLKRGISLSIKTEWFGKILNVCCLPPSNCRFIYWKKACWDGELERKRIWRDRGWVCDFFSVVEWF